ncbi:MAG: SPOR domain-containing protein [Magnetococcales bacterium]|nr:SPOR domain-containing protein [Magnetococcales bacterium]
MNPRYPTSRQFRRHRSRKLGRPLLLLGLMAGVALYWIFSSSPAPRKPEVAAVSESRNLEEEIAAHLKTTQPAAVTPPPAAEHGRHDNKEKDKEKEKAGASGDGRRIAMIDPPSLTDPTGRLEAPETPVPSEGSAAANHAPKPFTPIPVQARKPFESPKSSDAAKSTESSKSADAAKSVSPGGKSGDKNKAEPESTAEKNPSGEHEAKKSSEPEDPPMPSAPKELAPKARPPDVPITFYEELPKRKVIVPLEEPVENASSAKSTTNVAADAPPPRSPATPEKNGARTGPYVVQLAVFNDAQRAATMAGDLQKKGVPARVVKSKDGTLYRIRLGPFPTHAEATRSVTQWKLGGQSTLIFQDNEG